MPELPEVENVRRGVERRALGLVVSGVTVRRREVIVAPGDPGGGFGRARTGRKPVRLDRSLLLVGSRIARVLRRGKQLALVGGGDAPAVCVHLGMTGQVLYLALGAEPEDAAHAHVEWTLVRGGEPAGRLVFRDPRRFGGLWVYPTLADLEAARWAGLGPDALSVTGAQLFAALGRTKRAVKAALLDQAVVAGVGNIYADEALFRAGVDPRTPACELGRERAVALAGAIRGVMREAVRAGGSTLRDYRGADGERGRQQLAHRVYGRAGLACVRCGLPLMGAVIGQRSTVWCGGCQS